MGLIAFLAMLGTPLAPSLLRGGSLFALLLGLQFLLGVAQAPTFPVSAGVFETWFQPSRWALVVGLQTIGLQLGAAVTPPLIATLMHFFGWRNAILWTTIPALGLIGCWAWYGRNTPREHPSVSREELAEIGRRRALPCCCSLRPRRMRISPLPRWRSALGASSSQRGPFGRPRWRPVKATPWLQQAA
jgi:ACS family hexuronate transporter-like MFS transporter